MWYISSTVNEGYPYNTDFIGIITHVWTEGKHNYSLWRIDETGEVNDGYPYTYYMEQWTGSGGGGEEGDGSIFPTAGYKRNYGNFTSANRGNMNGGHRDQRKTTTSATSTLAAIAVNGYVTTGGGVSMLKSALNQFPTTNPGDMVAVSQIYGGNIFNSVIISRMFPFDIPVSSSQNGIFTMNTTLASGTQYYLLTNSTVILDFGEINLNITQGYEISKYTYKIYLPFSGVHSLDIRGNEKIYLLGYVDLFAGTIDYIVFINDQMELTAQGKIGIDIPINLNQGEMLQNAIMNGIKYSSQAISAVAPLVGGIVGGVGGELISSSSDEISKVGQAAQNMTVPISTSTISGGASAADMDLMPRIIYKELQMLNNNTGVEQIQGATKNTTVDNMNSLTGYTRFINYKCGVTNITAEESQEIERLLTQGIII